MLTTLSGRLPELYHALPVRRRAPVPDSEGTPTPEHVAMRSLSDVIAIEMTRARADRRSFSVLHIPGRGLLPGRIDVAQVIEALRPVLRDVDTVGEYPDGVGILLTDTDRVGAERTRERVAAAIGVEAASVQKASYPDDALTVGGLRAVLDGTADFRLRMAGLPRERFGPAGAPLDVEHPPGSA